MLEKKVKKISEMNIEPSRSIVNGSAASSSVSMTPKPHLTNGGYPDRPYNCLSNDSSFPASGISALRIPVVVVLTLTLFIYMCSYV